MEQQKDSNRRERLIRHENVQRMIEHLSLAERGFFLLAVSSPDDVRQILDIIQTEVPKRTGLPMEIITHTIGAIPGYDAMNEDEIGRKVRVPFQQWVNTIQKPLMDDAKSTRLFVIDGTNIGNVDRNLLIDHFAFMNGPRDKIAGNKRGPTLVIIPTHLQKIEEDIGRYADLMSCCSGQFYVE